jgi:uncharacterized membrane protein
MPRHRLEAFSDGVFAIAITLLALEITVPDVKRRSLGHALLGQWPDYAAYVVSFATIGIIWINHHAALGYVKRVDRTLLLMNLALLMWVTLIPWPTTMLAEYMRAGGANERVAASVYAGTMTLMGMSFGALWLAITRRAHVSVEHAQTRRFVIGAPIYALSIAMALVSAPACLVVNALLAVFYALPVGGAIAEATESDGG